MTQELHSSPTSKWNHRFLNLAALVGTWSKDPQRQVGAVITDISHRIISVGYNGFPAYVKDTPELHADLDEKLRRTVHAEKNAILFAARPLASCTIYVTRQPCAQCAAFIIQAGIMTVVCPRPAPHTPSKWRDDWASAEAMFVESGVELRFL